MHLIAIQNFGNPQWGIRRQVGQMRDLTREWMPVTFRIVEKRMKTRDVSAPQPISLDNGTA